MPSSWGTGCPPTPAVGDGAVGVCDGHFRRCRHTVSVCFCEASSLYSSALLRSLVSGDVSLAVAGGSGGGTTTCETRWLACVETVLLSKIATMLRFLFYVLLRYVRERVLELGDLPRLLSW